ncbi:MAG: DUF4058 family protein [Isosphaeraceae bacterium]
MPSPFPGMNPYLEQPSVWPDFHTEFLTSLRRILAPTLGPDYIVRLEQHIYVHDIPPGPRRLVGRADVALTEASNATAGSGGLGVLEAPALVNLPALDAERVPYLEIRDRSGQTLITVIEFLSPSNKRPGADRESYLAKRREILASPAHLVEIDLLRGGRPMPADDRADADYSVLVSRAERRPQAEFWPIRLRDRLPVIPIPLRTPEADAAVDLQAVLERAFNGPNYEAYIYQGTPEPPLTADDDAWAGGLLAESLGRQN